MEKESNSNTKTVYRQRVHTVLAHSYVFYLFAFLAGLFLDFIFPVKFFKQPALSILGGGLIILATFLIFWAQKASRDFKKEKKSNLLTKKIFCRGPYRFTRGPTHLGLLLLILGFGLFVNAFFIVVFALVSFIVTKLVFLKKEEMILGEKYGDPYLEYKKLVRF